MLRCLFYFTQCHLMIWGSNPSEGSSISQAQGESGNTAPRPFSEGLPNKQRWRGLESLSLQAFQGRWEAGHWLLPSQMLQMEVNDVWAENSRREKLKLTRELKSAWMARKGPHLGRPARKRATCLPRDRGTGQQRVSDLVCGSSCRRMDKHLSHYSWK